MSDIHQQFVVIWANLSRAMDSVSDSESMTYRYAYDNADKRMADADRYLQLASQKMQEIRVDMFTLQTTPRDKP